MSAEGHGAPPARRAEVRRGPGPVHLVWALPLAGIAALALTAVAGFAACGVSGCSGGGFGPVTDLQPLAAVLVLVAGALLAAPLVLIRWAGRRGVQAAVAAVVGLGWAAWSWLTITAVI